MGEVAKLENALPPIQTGQTSVFSSIQKFQEVQQMADFLGRSNLVPKEFQGNPANCLIALEMANRLKADPIMVMQNLYIVHGKPAWSSQFLISCVNSCGRFSALQYEFFGTEGQDDWGCRAYATELQTKQIVKGPKVTLKMAKDEGWSTKNGSKWKTMPELMLTYRAATFFVRTKAPEVSMGMQSEDEVKDMGEAVVVHENEPEQSSAVEFYPQDEFEKNYPTWMGIIESGKRTADEIITTIECKAPLTDQQKQKLEKAA